MAKFKIGDRVRALANMCDGNIKIGDTGTVIDLRDPAGTCCLVKIDGKTCPYRQSGNWHLGMDEFELISTPQQVSQTVQSAVSVIVNCCERYAGMFTKCQKCGKVLTTKVKPSESSKESEVCVQGYEDL